MIVKVCGVTTAAVAEVAVEAGADWIGLVLVPASPRHAGDAEARAVRDALGDRAALVGVFVDADLAAIEEAVDRYRLAAVQLHGEVPVELSAQAPVPVIRALNVRDAEQAFTDGWWPDGVVLLDAAPSKPGALPGGTGERVDTAVAASLARHRRVVLAGGLGPDTVAGAIAAVRPHGVDASSGLEVSPGVKDPGLVAAYVGAARAASA